MKRSKTMEFGVGLFMLAGILGLVFLGLKVSGLDLQRADDTYELRANFANIGGLKPRSPRPWSLVPAGRVERIELDTEFYDAVVVMSLDSSLAGKLPDDSTAAILTSGLLGEQYIGLSVGGSPEMIAEGEAIRDTQSALVLEELIQQFVSNLTKD